MPTLIRTRRAAGVAVGAMLLAAAAAAPASAATPMPVGPGQLFSATVNGAPSDAVIQVDCPGPLLVGQTGYALAGQSLAVTYEPDVPIPIPQLWGYTGDSASAIQAFAPTPSSTAANGDRLLATFTDYGTQQIPTNILLPCTGSGQVVFAPDPDVNGKTDVVSVTFEPVCPPGQVCPAGSTAARGQQRS